MCEPKIMACSKCFQQMQLDYRMITVLYFWVIKFPENKKVNGNERKLLLRLKKTSVYFML